MTGWRAYRILDLLAVICGVLALVMLMLPASTTVVPAAMRIPLALGTAPSTASTAMNTSVMIDSLQREMVRTNAFSAGRREPRARFVAPGSEPMPPLAVPSAFDPARSAFAPPDAETGPRLFGIVSANGATRALLQLHSSSEPPRLLGVGESVGGVRVVRIAGDRVVISSSSGTRTLRLSRAVPDSSENAP